MKPRANRALAKCPAKGLSAAAAWAALWMLVSLWVCSVWAVATMMANMTRLENVMPANTSSRLVRCLRWARAGLCRSGVVALCSALGFVAHLFEPVSALPEEQVRRDGRAQHGDEERQIGLAQLDVGNKGVAEDASPLMGDEDGDDEIREKCSAEHLEDERDAGEGAQHQQCRDEAARHQRPDPGRSGVEELHARADGDEVGGDVEAVGHDESDEEHGEDRSTGPVESLDGQLAEPCAGRKCRAVTDLLDRGHQRQGQQGGPQERQAVLGTGLGVGGDPGGIVVGRAR